MLVGLWDVCMVTTMTAMAEQSWGNGKVDVWRTTEGTAG